MGDRWSGPRLAAALATAVTAEDTLPQPILAAPALALVRAGGR
jgi:hypothetical protein